MSTGHLLHVTEELAYSIIPTFMSYVAQLSVNATFKFCRDSTDIQYLLQYFKGAFSCMSCMTQLSA